MWVLVRFDFVRVGNPGKLRVSHEGISPQKTCTFEPRGATDANSRFQIFFGIRQDAFGLGQTHVAFLEYLMSV